MATAGRGQVLAPWPNRLQDGTYEFEGRRHQLPLSEPEHANAIHGLVRWAAWQARELEPHRVVLGHVLHPRPGYPFALELRVAYELSEAGLAVRMTATNVGVGTCPYGSGAHPYVRRRNGNRRRHRPARAGRDGVAVGRARHPGRLAFRQRDGA